MFEIHVYFYPALTLTGVDSEQQTHQLFKPNNVSVSLHISNMLFLLDREIITTLSSSSSNSTVLLCTLR
jgi:hypothetical protein